MGLYSPLTGDYIAEQFSQSPNAVKLDNSVFADLADAARCVKEAAIAVDALTGHLVGDTDVGRSEAIAPARCSGALGVIELAASDLRRMASDIKEAVSRIRQHAG